MIPEFYSRRPEWADRIERIVESLGRIGVLEERSGQAWSFGAATGSGLSIRQRRLRETG